MMEKLISVINERLDFIKPMIEFRKSQEKISAEELIQLSAFLKADEDFKISKDLILSIQNEHNSIDSKRESVLKLNDRVSHHLVQMINRSIQDSDFYEVLIFREPENENYKSNYEKSRNFLKDINEASMELSSLILAYK